MSRLHREGRAGAVSEQGLCIHWDDKVHASRAGATTKKITNKVIQTEELTWNFKNPYLNQKGRNRT